MSKRHHMQIARSRNMDMISKWIRDAGGMEKISPSELVRKAQLVIGCTKKKAIEYIETITGEVFSDEPPITIND